MGREVKAAVLVIRFEGLRVLVGLLNLAEKKAPDCEFHLDSLYSRKRKGIERELVTW